MAKGSTEQRLQLARLMNLRFYDNLQDVIKDKEVKPGTFKKVLKQTIGLPIRVDVVESRNPKAGQMLHILKGDGVASGYSIELPFTDYYKRIHQSSALIFLQETQKFFEEVLNPKFFKRFITMLGKGYDKQNLYDLRGLNVHCNALELYPALVSVAHTEYQSQYQEDDRGSKQRDTQLQI